jgi:tricorn protease
LWLVNISDLRTEKIPRTDSNDIYPMWIGDKIYFLSDRNGRMTLFSYDPKSKAVNELIKNTGKDIMSASAGPIWLRCGHISRTSRGRFATPESLPAACARCLRRMARS